MRMRHQVLVSAHKKQAKEAVDSWLKQVNSNDPATVTDEILHAEYKALGHKIKQTIDAGERKLEIEASMVSHLPDAALSMFDTVKLNEMYRLTALKIPAATHPSESAHPPRHVEIIGSFKLTEVAVAHRQPEAISVVFSALRVSLPAKLSDDKLHISVQRCSNLRRLDLSGTAATEILLQADVSVPGVALVPPPQLRHLHGRIAPKMDPNRVIWNLIWRNKALHLVSAPAADANEVKPPPPVAASTVLCLGEALYLMELLDIRTDFGAHAEDNRLPTRLCTQQAIMRNLFGPALRPYLGDEWVDGPGVGWGNHMPENGNPRIETFDAWVLHEDSDSDVSQAEDHVPEFGNRRAHSVLSRFRGEPGSAERDEYITGLVAHLENWPPVREYIQHHSKLQSHCDTANAYGLLGLRGDKKIATIATANTDLSLKIRKEWIRSQLDDYKVLLPSPPPRFQELTRTNRSAHNSKSAVRFGFIKPSSPYEKRVQVQVSADMGGRCLETRITPRATVPGSEAAVEGIPEYDIAIEKSLHVDLGFNEASPALFYLPPGTTLFRIHDARRDCMSEFMVPQAV
jgi:hypothetical protein